MRRAKLTCTSVIILAIVGYCSLVMSCAEKVKVEEVTPNAFSVIDRNSDEVVYNGHVYKYDTSSGATVLPSRSPDGKIVEPLPLDKKEALLYWTAQPPMGLIEGEYYQINHPFGHFEATYYALVDLVIDKGRIVHIEMDEQMPASYYNKTWANQFKRRTGYTFFQFSKPRTDTTKVTWANGITFLEWQILKENSLNIDFNTVYGSSNSARDGFIPAVSELAKMIKTPSGKYYIAYAKALPSGITPRLELVFQGDKIVNARYDEIFADTKDAITDPAQKKYYRQSKGASVSYAEETNNAFKQFERSLVSAILEKQSLVTELNTNAREFATYKELIPVLNRAIERYKKDGYTHDIGTIDQRPKDMPINEEHISRQNEIAMTLMNFTYDKAQEKAHLQVKVVNNGTKDYAFSTGAFYMYVMNTKGVYDTVADPNKQNLAVAPGKEIMVDLTMGPIYPTDYDMSLKYDGKNKVYHSMPIKETK